MKNISVIKKIGLVVCSAVLLTGTFGAYRTVSAEAESSSGLTYGCKAAYLMDADSGECVYKYNEHARMPIASVCKVMTLTLCLDAVAEGRLSLDEKVNVSQNAAGMGGSQIYLESGYSYPLSDLVKSIVVCSANDSCVAVAERVSGSEEQFVADMNKKAAELGLSDTLFANCTGLPKETQYSCAADVAVMFANLIKHSEFFTFSKVWMEDFAHGNGRVTSMTNTNKLLKRYNGCDGGKTGFTSEAGYCLATTAKRENLRLVSVVLGADTSDNRFKSATSLFDYGFNNYCNKIILDKTVTLNDDFALNGGKKSAYSVMPEADCYLFCKKGADCDVTFEVTDNKVKAPVAKGQIVGKIDVYREGVLYKSVNVVSAEDVKKASYADRLKAVADGWSL